MVNSPFVKSEIAQALLNLTPPLIQESLLDDAHFCDEFEFARDPILAFGDSGPSFLRSRLYNTVRKALTDETDLKVMDTDGKAWKIVLGKGNGQQRYPAISNNGHQIALLPHSTLLPDSRERFNSVDNIAHHFNLPVSSRKVWRNIVCRAPFRR